MIPRTVQWPLGIGNDAGATEGLRERKKRLVRQQLSDTATEMFLERGFDDVRVADVAAACGVSAVLSAAALVLDFPEETAVAGIRAAAEGDRLACRS